MSNVTVSAAGQVATAFDFTVDKFPLSGPDGMSTPWYALFRSDGAGVVGEGSVTDRYVPHQTEDVIALVDACENVFDEASQVKTHFRNGHYVSIAPSDEYRRSIYGGRDNIFPRLIIRGGYDRSAFNVTLGIYRDACQNLAMLRSVSETYQSIRHTSGLRFAMDELIGQFQTLKEGWQTLTNLCESMQAVEVSMVDFLNAPIRTQDSERLRSTKIVPKRFSDDSNRSESKPDDQRLVRISRFPPGKVITQFKGIISGMRLVAKGLAVNLTASYKRQNRPLFARQNKLPLLLPHNSCGALAAAA
jgi:hypothetical protein